MLNINKISYQYNINKKLRGAQNNNLIFKCYNRSIYFNVKTNNTLIELGYTCLFFGKYVRRHMKWLLFVDKNTTVLYSVKKFIN